MGRLYPQTASRPDFNLKAGCKVAIDKMIDLIRRGTRNLRRKRMQQFLKIMEPLKEETILDIGGYPDLWQESGYQGPVTFLNLESPGEYRPIALNCRYVQGDGRHLIFPNKSFDIVFSNSVIEHVGNWEDQKAFAKESSRVGKRYWIQTPNKNFPVEPHYNFPLFQFLPIIIREYIAIFWPLSFYKRQECLQAKELKDTVRTSRLLSKREMQILFPDGQLWTESFLGMDKSIVAYRDR